MSRSLVHSFRCEREEAQRKTKGRTPGQEAHVGDGHGREETSGAQGPGTGPSCCGSHCGVLVEFILQAAIIRGMGGEGREDMGRKE